MIKRLFYMNLNFWICSIIACGVWHESYKIAGDTKHSKSTDIATQLWKR